MSRQPKALLADKGYDGDRFRESLLTRGIPPIIPPRANRKVPEHPDYRRYRDRNLAAARLWMKSFVNTA
jgi:IS5 family transposase